MALQENNPGQIEQLRAPKIAMSKSDQELWEHSFLLKCRERLNNHVPKFCGPRLDNWDLWKEDWRTAIETSMHPSVDGEGRKLSIKEAQQGEAAIQGQHITKVCGCLTADQMNERLDNVFMPKQESSLARLEFQQYKQHPVEPALAYLANKRMLFNKGWPTNQNLGYLLTKTLEDLCNVAVKRDLYKEADTGTNHVSHSWTEVGHTGRPSHGHQHRWALQEHPEQLHLPEPPANGCVHSSACTAAKNAGSCQVPEPLGT